MSDMLNAALKLRARGFALFPCRPKAKEPATKHGHKDATRDAEQIRAWWATCPDYNIGLACAASGVVVIDVDPRNGGEATMQALLAYLGPLPETVTASTGGGGWHLYFKAPSGSEFRGQLGPGVDCKHHGYVLAARSIHPNGHPYRWCTSPFERAIAELTPTWLASALQKPVLPAQTSAATSGTRSAERNTAYGEAALAAELERVRTTPQGQRNNTLNEVACKLAGLHAGGELLDVRENLVSAAMAAGLPEREARKTVESGWKKGLQQPRSAPAAQAAASNVVDTSVLLRADPRPPRQGAAPLVEDTICLANVQPRKPVWIWRGRLASGEMVVITGMPGVGKGLLLCYIVACYTMGRPMFGDHSAAPAGHVVWVSVEDAHDTSLVPRLQAAGADITRVHAWNMNQPLSLPDDTSRIVAQIEQHRAAIVILDPAPTLLDREHSSNNDADVRRSFAPLLAACRSHNCALLLVRHTNKRTLGSAMDRGGGSIGWTGMARIELMLGRLHPEEGAETDEALVTLATIKNNLTRWPRSLDLRVVEVGESARMEVVGETGTTADDLCSQERPRAATKANEAASMLRELLKDGQWHPYTEIAQAADQAQMSRNTLNRAKQALGVDSKQFADGWHWRAGGQEPNTGTVGLWAPGHLPK
jgi:hypothetical protein